MRYNLLTEPWIPVAFTAGGRAQLGIRDVLARASEIRRVEGDTPAQTAMLLRLLLAIVYRADDVDAYLARWHHRGRGAVHADPPDEGH